MSFKDDQLITYTTLIGEGYSNEEALNAINLNADQIFIILRTK